MIEEEPSEISRIGIIITEMKSSLDELDSRLEMVGGRISELEGKSRENFQTKEQRGKKTGDRSTEACVTVSNIST